MMRTKKGLGDSIWASRGKSTNHVKHSPPSTSVITPAAPLPPREPKPRRTPSPKKTSVAAASGAKSNGHTPNGAATPNGASTPNGAASTTATTATNATAPPKSQQEFKRYIQIVRRLKWKLPYLSHGYHIAIAKPGDPLFGGETNAAEAELMFKLDFYEYYMLLERALIHLLGVFDLKPIRGAAGARWNGAGAGRRSAATSNHSFHEDVLAALEAEGNPLKAAMGTGDVIFCLYRAKELRNRWKYAEDGERTGVGRERDGTAPLETYDLDKIFGVVFKGFDAGYFVAEGKVAEDVGGGSWADEVEMEVDDDEFGFIVEAMDWEAI
ncbi:hypothetical protein C8034_v004824 [Colletotrichum sidae]|uniref:Uncharacterized protein n=1 Tax=Colletotrichum sidae TaxID=1347389 RepID=A0A4R8T7C6_9PEZI|nr:hypothetical protein C8034_v004824 [Colletotrichum sidae]